MNIELGGGLNSALTHFALVGLAAILEEAGATKVRLGWTAEGVAKARITWEGPEAGDAVKGHAERHADEGSWVQAKGLEGDTGLFSPRIKVPKAVDGWIDLEGRREAILDSGLTELDARMVSNLGEPGYWVVDNRENQPDRAASRWEMKTRNRGEEFIGKRLAPLAAIVAARPASSITDGLTGASTTDRAGKDSPGSRTSTGLTPPGPTDDALAWCGLWGISSFALVPAVSKVSATSGASPLRALHPRRALIPVADHMLSPAAWRALMASRAVNDLASADTERQSAAVAELPLRGVIGACDFTVHKGGSSSAPERMILSGEFHLLEYFLYGLR
ncbi:MAG: hypothetical protein SOH99_00020 [Acidipropionibacterium acidipropionici]|jgi:CRISPR-associated protein Csb3|uniref:Uncharacterized protein n=1 Tax=Acidipropionibacterium acidipropionici TaxID=1748 RepID=A0AAC8YEU9_9ACTN|nr:hypothetical protein [Acidipropionibacterium acidipropionici]AMS05408.1 hypothetical protein AXH35_07995 [Acidipropionibacterium acidipropionici]AOZ46882.1 hypothetical protein A8L58_09450 [Acidipropionibacterium acidipropionici]AZP37036.1 hypothetical protein DUY81_03745 [Acidipropionibacterium acidipropionici]